MEVQLKRFNSMERRPRMLKDFLISENATNYSCSSSGFKSLPRRLQNDVVSFNHSYSSTKSTFQTVINTIRKNFTMRKSPSMLSLPRSLSRKLSSRKRTTSQQISTVKIKDIIRWKSFRDMQPSLPSPPLSPLNFHRYMTESSTTVTTTTTATTCSSSSSSGGSSWSEGDFFTAWEAENDSVEVGKKVSFSPFVVVGNDSVAPFVGAKEELTCQEDEQHSPVSVLQLGDDEFSPFDQSLAYIKRRKQKLKQTVEKFESLILDENSYYDEEYEDDDSEKYQKAEEQDWVEERAKQLLNCLNTTTLSIQSCEVVLDFFREEITKNGNKNKNNIEGFEWEILRIAEDWINGSFTSHDIVNVNKDTYIKEMDRRCRWNKFEEEQEDLALEIENAIFHSLVDDLLDLDGSY